MPAPQAKFEFVATGDAAVNAQIESVVNNLVRMKQQAREAGETASVSMEKARMSTHLLNEELGLHIPRAMQKVMASTPGLSKALSMAFTITAAVGFVEIIDKLIEKMPTLTNAMMGFGEEAQKVFTDLKNANMAIAKAIEDNQGQALSDTLLGLSGSKLDAGKLNQLIDKREELRKERAKASATIGAKDPNETNTMGGPDVMGLFGSKPPKHVDVVNQQVAELTAQITGLDGQIVSLTKHFSHDLGDEGSQALDKLNQAAQKARDAVNKMLGGMDQANRDPIQQAIATENAGETQKLTILKDALNKKVITILQYNVRERQIVTEHMNALRQITEDGWQKIVGGFGVNAQGAIPQGLFAKDPFEGLRKSFTDAQKLITQGLEEEAAKERVISDQAKATGEEQYTTEQKLQEIRGKSAAQLQAIADKMEQIARAMGDAGMIAEADKFEAKLQDLRIKTASWATDLKKALNQDMQNAFVGIVSGTETVSQAFHNMAQSILAELAKIVFQMYIVKLLQMALGGIFGGGSAGSAGNSVGGGLSSVLGSFGGGRASGGPVLPGMSYMVGEHGPEPLIMGRSGGFILPNSGSASPTGAPGGVQVNIHNYGQPMEQSQTSRFDGHQYVVEAVIKDIQSNGPIRQALR